jgi:hypothetical protein
MSENIKRAARVQ